ncbi:MAG: DUF3500 domain-containing protein [Planctomycetes bacterium]|nr:DUF3500 domain-containing protein [Planctomycetota bacterium]
MKNRSFALSLLLAACASAPTDSGSAAVVHDVAVAAKRLLGQLSHEQQQLAWRPLDDPEAMAWQFVPGRYAGIELGAMEPVQRSFARDVVRAMLSDVGFGRLVAVMDLENVLREMEAGPGKDVSHRDPGRYSLLICGRPAVDGTFVVRFQGHHVSLRMAVVDGVLAGFTPHFLGANPHRIATGDEQAGLDAEVFTLHAEEDVARELMAALTDEQRARAIVDPKAPADVLLGPGKAPDALGERVGLPVAELTGVPRELLWKLLRVYVDRYRSELAGAELRRIAAEDLDVMTFAWAGSLEKGQGHYYRLHGARFAIEYDNTQNGANHIHTVWRDFDRDFGGDPLREHLAREHDR